MRPRQYTSKWNDVHPSRLGWAMVATVLLSCSYVVRLTFVSEGDFESTSTWVAAIGAAGNQTGICNSRVDLTRNGKSGTV